MSNIHTKMPLAGRGAESTKSKRVRRSILVSLVCLWVVSISVPLGLFSASHMAVLPVAEESVIESSENWEGWRLVHVLAEDCPCSKSVIEYLVQRNAQQTLVEEVVLLDGSDALVDRLRMSGFSVTVLEAEDLCESLGSEGVPFFQVIEGGRSPRYSGAYFDSAHRATNGFLDLKTYSRIKDGGFVLNRPVFGCATSERLRALLDPFGLKY
ncbi:hypothetical protein [Pelagicoccus mobilis]|uniref:Uncharacterized protein n=1 Tax=Pelagicoccus mobilis TaxID=415221 RepID=A0A934S2L5_9BACT|nr:hypothetical protein [Pelagicoccus mobilis]MBK1878289.1 hypothetical protein [Pelagicoccus mobilis]